jgi:hypothetical protein
MYLKPVPGFAAAPCLGAGALGEAAPEIIGLDHIMHLAAHLLFEFGASAALSAYQTAAAGGGHRGALGVVRPQFFRWAAAS